MPGTACGGLRSAGAARDSWVTLARKQNTLTDPCSDLIRKRTGVRNAWVAERLGMGHEANVTVALRRVRESKKLKRGFAKLEREIEKC